VHKAAAADDKKLQATLKRLGVSNLPSIEEVGVRRRRARSRPNFYQRGDELGHSAVTRRRTSSRMTARSFTSRTLEVRVPSLWQRGGVARVLGGCCRVPHACAACLCGRSSCLAPLLCGRLVLHMWIVFSSTCVGTVHRRLAGC
jgi:hypothetical protein